MGWLQRCCPVETKELGCSKPPPPPPRPYAKTQEYRVVRTASTQISSQEKPSPDILSAPTLFVFHLMMISLLYCRPLSLIRPEFSFFVSPHTYMHLLYS